MDRPTDGITPFLAIQDDRGAEALDFYVKAFGAVVVEKNYAQDGKKLMQAGLRLNGGFLMLADTFPEMGFDAKPSDGVTLHLQVKDADQVWAQALSAGGCTVIMDIADQFWGDRYGQLRDPFGHRWSIGSPLKG